jgi:hypothetical protein
MHICYLPVAFVHLNPSFTKIITFWSHLSGAGVFSVGLHIPQLANNVPQLPAARLLFNQLPKKHKARI